MKRNHSIKRNIILIVLVLCTILAVQNIYAVELNNKKYPIGEPGLKLTYNSTVKNLPKSVVQKIELTVGSIKKINGTPYQWLQLFAEKVNKQKFSVWLLASVYPSEEVRIAQKNIARYIISSFNSNPLEFVNQTYGGVVLPNTGAWRHLFPRAKNGDSPIESIASEVELLGIKYKLVSHKKSNILTPPKKIVVISLTPDLLIGVPHNSKVKNETRRYDESDYEYVELTKENYFEMIENGMNVFNVNVKQVKWIEKESVYYWGMGGKDVLYPECLYTSNYVGPAIFFDEPMVHTRDHALKPKFKKDPTLRKTITPKLFFEEFKHEYHKAKYERSPIRLLKELSSRKDVSIGEMNFLQQNIYTWETMPSSAIYQLSEGDKSTPYAMVFEPPGRLGAKRVLPELNMSFDCQIPADNPKNLIGIMKGFLRGAARVTNKEWGISIYGQVIRSEAFWYMTHTYDMGARLFFYWDSYQLAAVPYSEYLALSKNLREHSKNFPRRDLEKLKKDAEIAILIPPGYNFGHVKMGIGNISGLGELNMERTNSYGLKYREVMSNFYIEIERCIRLGVEYDAFWNLEELELKDYDEIVIIKEDGKVEVTKNGKTKVLDSARTPERPEGIAPQLAVEIKTTNKKALTVVMARAEVTEETSPIYYTQGANKDGIYRNVYVLWELYGPEEEDYTDFWKERWDVSVTENNNSASTEIKFNIDKPGNYRLKVSTSDLSGRSKVVWKNIVIEK
ncbi:MAG: hypothetical protein V3V16_04125 [Melioribacteraceae bacterium]